MPNDCISYIDSGYFSKLLVHYLEEHPDLQPLYNRFPKIEHFKEQIAEKGANYNANHRDVLVNELERQYASLEHSSLTASNIQLLKESNTFTITTGHQLNLFTGPLYFLYKIVINCKNFFYFLFFS